MLPTERDEINPQQRQVQRRVGVDDSVQHLHLRSRVEVGQAHLPHLGAGEAHAIVQQDVQGGLKRIVWAENAEGG